MKTPTLKEAEKIIELFSAEDDYIIENIKRFMDRNNVPDDNSIELGEYYQKCIEVLKQRPWD